MKSYSKFPAPITRGGNTSFVNHEQERPLTGVVQDQKAAEGEERLSRSLNKGISKGIIEDYVFRFTTDRRRTTLYKELDFLILTYGQPIAVSVRGTSYVHKSEASKNQDKLNDLIILKKLKELGYSVPRITNIDADKLDTQMGADKVAKDLGVYR